MRKSFDGLQGLIEGELKRRATSGEVFVFINKRKDRVKLLHWEAGGFVLYYKRLEKGTFELPDLKGQGYQIPWSELMMIIEGIRVKAIERRARFALEEA
ncbi:MAG: IS66 family insertion sequence element accessory protein TnpB [Bacteroidetes bacterium]|nr:IS66 family insertion sequence element accessory protein TnpB [Bacteroidota bacterium]